MNKIKFVTGTVKREITPQQAGNVGAGTFIFRLPAARGKRQHAGLDHIAVGIKRLTGGKTETPNGLSNFPGPVV